MTAEKHYLLMELEKGPESSGLFYFIRFCIIIKP
jgi:hypothetical protein